MENISKNHNIFSEVSKIIPQYCDKCGAKHSSRDLHVLEQSSSVLVCRLSCTNCNNVYVLQIHKDGSGGVTAKKSSIKQEFANELEERKFQDLEVIALDEVLEVYNILESLKTVQELISLFE